MTAHVTVLCVFEFGVIEKHTNKGSDAKQNAEKLQQVNQCGNLVSIVNRVRRQSILHSLKPIVWPVASSPTGRHKS